jgi:hypothetical protein
MPEGRSKGNGQEKKRNFSTLKIFQGEIKQGRM